MIDIALWQEDLKEEEQIKQGDVVVEGAGQRTLKELVEELIADKWVEGGSSLSMDHSYGLEQYIIAQLVKEYTGEENPYAGYETKYGYDSYSAELIADLKVMMDYLYVYLLRLSAHAPHPQTCPGWKRPAQR